MKKIFKVILLPVFLSIIAIALFLLSALIPQSAIQRNAKASVQQLLSQGQWEIVINKEDPTYTMDIYTDSQILMQSYNLNMEEPSSIFKNPKHVSEKQNWNMAVAFDEVVNENAENELSYSRYWMGFRFIIRPLLVFADYHTIRKTVAVVFWLLLFVTSALIGRRHGIKGVLCFGLPMALMNPAIVSHSLQFSCTFILAFIFLIIELITDSKKINVPLCFCLYGALTQLFDFYSTPLITYGLPLILLLTYDEFANKRWSTALKALAAWAYGYLSMWLIKMLCTTLFTDINGFAEAFGSFAGRVGITVTEGQEDKYDSLEALRLVYRNFFTGSVWDIVFVLLVVAFALVIVVSCLTCSRKEFLSRCVFIFIGLLPLGWFAVSAQPTVIHYWFQYRTVAVTLVSACVYATYVFFDLKSRHKRIS